MNHAWSHGRCINCGVENTMGINPYCWGGQAERPNQLPTPPDEWAIEAQRSIDAQKAELAEEAAKGLALATATAERLKAMPKMQEARIFLINGQMFGISVPAGQMEYQSWWNGVVASGFVYLDDAIIPLSSIASVIKGEALKSMIAQMNLMPAGSRMN